MTPSLRKLALTAHVSTSVGWLGTLAVFLAHAVAGLTSQDTAWGLFRHYWIVFKLLLTAVATIVLLLGIMALAGGHGPGTHVRAAGVFPGVR